MIPTTPRGPRQLSFNVPPVCVITHSSRLEFPAALCTAAHLEKCFDETTVEDIAQAAGVSRRTFFRYFASKNDLMSQGIVQYAGSIAEAIAACPLDLPPAEVFRTTVREVAQQTAAHPRTRKIMQIATQSATAREAQLSRVAELQECVAEAYLRRCPLSGKSPLAPAVLASLTLSTLAVTFRTWFSSDAQDIAATADGVFETLAKLFENQTISRSSMP